MILIKNFKNLKNIPKEIRSLSRTSKPFNSLCIDFIQEIYLELKKINFTKETSDLAALSFWLRTQNIIKIKNSYKSNIKNRASLGIVFHISPSNAPLNFFYSYLFGLISGNINIVRLPNKNFIELNIILEIIKNIFKNKKYYRIKLQTYFVQYDKKYEFTKIFSSICNVRIIWGGDETIKNIRKFSIPAKSREITFADKYSCCIINSDKIIELEKNKLLRVVQGFYNDGYFIDQNACSSPHIVFWVGKKISLARKIFWNKLELYAKNNYDLPEIGSVDKLTKYCEDILKLNIKNKININSFSYNLLLASLPDDISSLKTGWGYFYEYELKKIEDLKDIVTNKFQTLTYFGFKNKELLDNIIYNPNNGVDRIVPIGSAHSIDQFWDGYDLISNLTRIINTY